MLCSFYLADLFLNKAKSTGILCVLRAFLTTFKGKSANRNRVRAWILCHTFTAKPPLKKKCSPGAKLVEMAARRHRLCCSSKIASDFRKSAPPFLLPPKSLLRNSFRGPRLVSITLPSPPKRKQTTFSGSSAFALVEINQVFVLTY